MDCKRSTGRHARSRMEPRLRRCAATRLERSSEELIRFAAGPDGVIVPDLATRLPGRGVWVTADRQSVQRAVLAHAFAKSLRRKVEAPGDLADLVEDLMVRRVCEALSLANKAGLIATGFEKIDRRLTESGVAILVHGSNAASDGRHKLDRKFLAICGPAAAGRIVAVLTVEQMSLAIGRPNVVHAGLNTGGASDRFLAEAGRLMRYRSGIVHHSASFNAVEALTETANLDP